MGRPGPRSACCKSRAWRCVFEELTCLDLDRRSDDVCTIHDNIDRLHTEKGVVYVCHHHHCYHAEIWRISGIFSSFCFQFACYKGVECVTYCMYSTNLSGRANLEHPWLAVSPCCPTGKHGRHAVSPSNAFNASSLYHMQCIWYILHSIVRTHLRLELRSMQFHNAVSFSILPFFPYILFFFSSSRSCAAVWVGEKERRGKIWNDGMHTGAFLPKQGMRKSREKKESHANSIN